MIIKIENYHVCFHPYASPPSLPGSPASSLIELTQLQLEGDLSSQPPPLWAVRLRAAGGGPLLSCPEDGCSLGPSEACQSLGLPGRGLPYADGTLLFWTPRFF